MAPTAFRSGGKMHLVYELHVTNFSRRNITLVGVAARAAGGRAPLARYDALDLATCALRPGMPEVLGLDRLRVGPGLRVVIFMWVALDGAGAVPAALEHDVSVELEGDTGRLTVHGPAPPVRREIATFAPPLRGSGWKAANGASNGSAHRRALIPIDGRAVIAQRFAIDWTRQGADRRTFTGDERDNRSYHAYGAEALAVADGVVTEIKDGIPENVPGQTSRAVPITLETIGGNHVILDVGLGRYAFYAHLQPGSPRVKVGDRVRRGQVLGLVGNSGNSTEPHLHFHLGDASSPLGAEGIPYVIDSFESRRGDAGARAEKRHDELPMEDELVTFP